MIIDFSEHADMEEKLLQISDALGEIKNLLAEIAEEPEDEEA